MVDDMTHPPTTPDLRPAHSSDGSGPLSRSIAAAASSPLPGAHEVAPTSPFETSLVDQSGRPLGPRALRTRARILEATVSLLEKKSMRDLRVIDIARSIGSSPATFYQYFKDVNDVVLELATEVSDFTPEMIELIHGDWTGRAGYERGLRLANLVADYWDRYKAILRVRNNAADEGDPAFRVVRLKAMLPMVTAFAEVIEAAHCVSEGVSETVSNSVSDNEESEDHEFAGGQIRPLSGAMFMFTALESMAVHHEIFEVRFGPMGEGREALIETIATILQSTLTAKR
jgi:AcrR family transcriptional regulator